MLHKYITQNTFKRMMTSLWELDRSGVHTHKTCNLREFDKVRIECTGWRVGTLEFGDKEWNLSSRECLYRTEYARAR